MGYISMCGPKGYGFSAVLVINRVWSLIILVIERVWFLCFSLELDMFLEEATKFIMPLPITPSIKALPFGLKNKSFLVRS